MSIPTEHQAQHGSMLVAVVLLHKLVEHAYAWHTAFMLQLVEA
jgi:hypothetical protein